MKRSTSEIYQAARSAGLSVPAATIATAIALAESSGDDQVLGDTGIQTSEWGPSVGLWQIRTRKDQYGTGGDRDLLALRGNVGRQATAMRNISAGGTNWAPWTVYTRGTYGQYMGQAQQAAGVVGGTGVQQLGLVDGGVGDMASKALDQARDLLLKLGAAGLGLALVGVGLVLAVRPKIMAGQAEVKKAFTGMGG